jgi:outer membrane cobalamin receptor
VEVIGTTPLPGLGTALSDVPANVQVFGNRDFARQRPLDLTGFLDRNANSVGVGSGQGNPYQQDLNFRGFAASPLLGTPQGISVFQDGVRINEAFGDVVNWDLLPRSAISTIQLIPGSNPVFGLNTLGGACPYTPRAARNIRARRWNCRPVRSGVAAHSSNTAARATASITLSAMSQTTRAGQSTTPAASDSFSGRPGFRTTTRTST